MFLVLAGAIFVRVCRVGVLQTFTGESNDSPVNVCRPLGGLLPVISFDSVLRRIQQSSCHWQKQVPALQEP